MSSMGRRFFLAACCFAFATCGVTPFVCRANESSPAPTEVTANSAERPALSAEVPAAAEKLFAGEPPASVADLKLMQQQVRQVTEKVTPAIVGVRLGASHGSGVIVSAEGHVLTAAHVAQQADIPIEILLPDGRRLKGRTLGLHRSLDAALLKISDPGPWPYVAMGKSNNVKVGQWCLALGQPGGFERGRNPVLRFGRVLETNNDLVVSDCTLVGGDSGGPLFDAAGRVIGIHSRIGGRITDNLHVPISAFSGAWDRLLAGEVWGHLPGQTPFIGVKGAAGDKEARITQVFKDTPAQDAGLQVGDVVVRFDGDEVTDFASLTTLVSRKEPGQKTTIEVRRGEDPVKLSIVIGKR